MTEDYITIRGMKVRTKNTRLPVNKLKFYPDNPRIYSAIGAADKPPTQEEIHAKLSRMDHVKELIQDIKLNGDLIDPIIVKSGTYEVLEGNSRLAAYRELASVDPIKWGKMRSVVLPQDIDDALVFALLGQYHIKGKKDWQPYEQAGFLQRRHKQQEVPIDQLAHELGINPGDARTLVGTYEFMLDGGIRDSNKWSFAFEYNKSRKMKKHRRAYAHLDAVIVRGIKQNQFGTAMEFRDGLKDLGDAPEKAVRRFAEGELSFDEAVDAAQSSGNTNEVYKRLNRFRKWVVRKEIHDTIEGSKGEERKKVRYELKKLSQILSKYE